MGGVDERTLGKRLQLVRKRAGLTQQQLCQKAGLSYSTLAKIERGAIASPSVFTVAAIANATNASLEDLLGVKNPNAVANNAKKRSKNGVSFVYFDINGTLVRFFHRAFVEIARETGRPADLVETVYLRHSDEVCSGSLSLQEFNAIFAHELGVKDFDWQQYYMGSVEAMPGIAELMEWTAKNYEVGILSNIMPGFIQDLRSRQLIPDAHYAAIVDSSDVHAIKPDKRIFEIAQDLAAVDPGEILLIDDTQANVRAADALGWHVLWFDYFHPEESIKRIRQTLDFWLKI